jgi:hypothetical protein
MNVDQLSHWSLKAFLGAGSLDCTDKNPAYGEAIVELKKEGWLPKETRHRQVKYLNNRLEGDHGRLKRLIQPTLGFQSMKTAYATIKGFEVMRMFKKGQFAPWIDAICGGTEVHFINRLFGLYAWAAAALRPSRDATGFCKGAGRPFLFCCVFCDKFELMR